MPPETAHSYAELPLQQHNEYGMSVLDLDLTGGVMTVEDEFTPFNEAYPRCPGWRSGFRRAGAAADPDPGFGKDIEPAGRRSGNPA